MDINPLYLDEKSAVKEETNPEQSLTAG